MKNSGKKITIAFFDTKPYDRERFDLIAPEYGFRLKYIESKLGPESAVIAEGCDGVIAFVNDTADAETMTNFMTWAYVCLLYAAQVITTSILKLHTGKFMFCTCPVTRLMPLPSIRWHFCSRSTAKSTARITARATITSQ